MKVLLEKLDEKARLPEKGKPGDFCYDVWAVSEEEIAPNVWRYGLGFRYEIERESLTAAIKDGLNTIHYDILPKSFNISIDFRPRSSIWQTGMSLSNGPGTLDEFYRGEAMAVFYHVMPNMPRYKKGDKIGQIKIGFAPEVTFEFVDKIDTNTARGEGGFGSTGKK